ncbi:MAG: YhcH/YjgK/YiaL family protein [Oscillospiraceae bacterium]|nr:YhcH/YjgK/YiaL family protein [Oscillospiraceae bacterium]
MICAALSEASCYRGLHPRLDRALALLTPDFLASVGPERRLLEGEDLTVTRFELDSSADEERLFEYHEQYIDIFTLAEGCERVDTAGAAAVRVLEQRGDYWGGAAQAEQSLILTPGRFLVLFPGEAHRPGMAVDTPRHFSRIVFKIRFKEA